jgi:hypothetical protein
LLDGYYLVQSTKLKVTLIYLGLKLALSDEIWIDTMFIYVE